MLEIDGEIKDFNLEEFDTTSQFYCMEGEEYFSGYESFSRIIEIKDNAIVCAPHAYDSQGIYQDGPFEEYPLAKDVKWEEISITSWIVITDDMENEERYEKQYRELTDEDLITLNECGCGAAFLWFNDEMKVEKVLFWGELTIME